MTGLEEVIEIAGEVLGIVSSLASPGVYLRTGGNTLGLWFRFARAGGSWLGRQTAPAGP